MPSSDRAFCSGASTEARSMSRSTSAVGVGRLELVHRPGTATLSDMQLEAGRPGVHGQHPHEEHPLMSDQEFRPLDAYWRAANYLAVGQIYLLDNPLLRRPLEPHDVKPRLLGHWGTTPGLNFIYTHLNRAIRRRDLDAIFVAGPGHGGPAVVAQAYLEGTYSELYPHI